MLHDMAGSPRTVGELAEPFEMSLAAASKHIRVLERAGLVRRTVRGRTHICRLEAGPLREGAEWMRRYERFWTERLDALEAQLRSEDAGELPRPPRESRPSVAAPRGPRIVRPREGPSRKNPRRKNP